MSAALGVAHPTISDLIYITILETFRFEKMYDCVGYGRLRFPGELIRSVSRNSKLEFGVRGATIWV